MKKRLLSILLCFVMVLGLLPITASAATGTVPNARIDGDYLKWNAVADASYYCVFINYSPTERVSAGATLSFNLKDYCKDRYPNKNLNVQIAAYKENGSALTDFTSAGSYANTAATKQQLTTPGNVQWNGFNVTWNPVANATGYTVILTREYYLSGSSYSENYYRLPTTTNSLNIEEYCVPDIEYYRVSITATADGYLESEMAYGQKRYTEADLADLPTRNIQNVEFDHAAGILSWDPFDGAARYEIEVYTISPLSNYYRISATGYITQSADRMTFDVGAFCYENDIPKSRDYFSDCHVLLTAIGTDNREISAKWQIDNYEYNYSYGREVEPLLNTTVTYSGAARYNQALIAYVSGLPDGVGADKLSYQWQYKNGSSWVNIGGANDQRYQITDANMVDKQIRVMVTVEGYLSALYGAAKTVTKEAAPGAPGAPALTVTTSDDGTATVTFDPVSTAEYIYKVTSDAAPSAWPNASDGYTAITGNSFTVEQTASDQTVRVLTRYKETPTRRVGTYLSGSTAIIPAASTGGDDGSSGSGSGSGSGGSSGGSDPINANSLIYPEYGTAKPTIYVKKGQTVTVKYQISPANATANLPTWKERTFDGDAVLEVNTQTASTESGVGTITIKGNAVTSSSGVPVTPYISGTETLWDNGYSYDYDLAVVVYDPVNEPASVPLVYSDLGSVNLCVGETYYLNFTDLKSELNFLPTGVSKEGYTLKAYILQSSSMGSTPTYVNSNANISIDPETGRIAADAVGNGSMVYIVALASGETANPTRYIATLTVNVIDRPAVNGLVVMPQKVTMKPGETRQLTASTSPANAVGDITWDSEDTDVVTVDNTGNITAVANGVASVYAVCGDVRAYSVVTVKTMCDNHDFNIVSMGDDSCTAICVNCGYTTTMDVPTANNSHPNNRPNNRPSRPSGGSSTTATVNSAKTGDVGIALYAALALTSYTGSALVIRGRKRK